MEADKVRNQYCLIMLMIDGIVTEQGKCQEAGSKER